MAEPKRYTPFVNGTAFMGMLEKKGEKQYGPAYSPDTYGEYIRAADLAEAQRAAGIAMAMWACECYFVNGRLPLMSERETEAERRWPKERR